LITTTDVLRARREEILRIADRHSARDVRVFGSVTRGEASENNDVDLLVSTRGETSPWFPAALVAELERVLERKVDVVTEGGL
jgi:predicted nucleotidyltransferase